MLRYISQILKITIFFTDGSVMRTCAKLKVPVDDCKTANDVTYCYCKRELCNNPSQKLDKPGSGIGSNHNPHGLQIQSIDPSKGIYECFLTFQWMFVRSYLF